MKGKIGDTNVGINSVVCIQVSDEGRIDERLGGRSGISKTVGLHGTGKKEM